MFWHCDRCDRDIEESRSFAAGGSLDGRRKTRQEKDEKRRMSEPVHGLEYDGWMLHSDGENVNYV